jgi:hypothetical protein
MRLSFPLLPTPIRWLGVVAIAAVLVYWFQGDGDTTLLLGSLVVIAISTWAAYVLGAAAIRRFVPELD